ncbi:LOW QUALITY PROTEIN: xanthine dehydrogenase/oxidase-like [Haliotis rubra]|uniref:LOW QUALITY PROTEIN: xanthine dehydrogenase/oxidase-like n=1 Tax=Haliotis rubra TaxID=36100 RepID=UPI001EE5938B|nr:LOW QUALITY PROTEIN: xanthine dehydrogenase/oxidase-like [Haliotis rubra]
MAMRLLTRTLVTLDRNRRGLRLWDVVVLIMSDARYLVTQERIKIERIKIVGRVGPGLCLMRVIIVTQERIKIVGHGDPVLSLMLVIIVNQEMMKIVGRGDPVLSLMLVIIVNQEMMKIIEERNPDPCLSLLDYLRHKLRQTGSKAACAEGGCGACTVMLSEYDEKTEKVSHFAVLACILPVCCVHGLAVTTVEGIGSTKTRLHPVQKRLAEASGTQCGFCAPGMVMSMYALLRNNPEPSEDQIRRFLDGNVCRCTGYRTILDGFRTFAKPNVTGTKHHSSYDPTQESIFPPELKNKWNFYQGKSLVFKSDSSTWYRPTTLTELLDLKSRHPDAKIAAGNTEISVETHCKGLNYHVFIEVCNVPELRQVSRSPSGITFGSAVTISNVIEALQTVVSDMPEDKTRVFRGFLDVLKWFGNTQIRNVSSIGGNIVTASPLSDLVPMLMSAGATVHVARKGSVCMFFNRLTSTIVGSAIREMAIDPSFYVKYRTTCLDPDDVLLSLTIPTSGKNEFFHGYKQASRKESCVATCNAGMRVVFEDNSDVSLAKRSGNQGNLPAGRGTAIGSGAPVGMCEYRQSLTTSFFYKFYLSVQHALCHQNGIASDIPRHLRSALLDIDYTLPSPSHVYDDVTSCHPADDTGKMYGIQHATGETMFLDDMAPSEGSREREILHVDDMATSEDETLHEYESCEGELFMALVLSKRPHGRLVSVDATEALTLPGVVDFITHKDIPGAKTWGQPGPGEEVFASDVVNVQTIYRLQQHFRSTNTTVGTSIAVSCRGQTIGAIVAESAHAADHAASMVNIVYEDLQYFLTIKEAIEYESFHGAPQTLTNGDPDSAFKTCDHVLEGEARTAPQEHFYLETMGTLVIPGGGDGKMEVYTNTESSSSIQETICKVLGVTSSKVEVKVKNPGGTFCGKQTRILLTCLPAAVAAQKLGRPVRCVLDRHVDMTVTGTRCPTWAHYKVGFDSDGNIIAYSVNVYVNAGMSVDQSRAIRLTNMYKTGDVAHCLELSLFNARRCWEECMIDSQFERRRKEVDKFNSENRWRKRGLSMVPVRLAISSPEDSNQVGVIVQIYLDGSVVISPVGGIPGHDANVKMVQIVSEKLNVPTSFIRTDEARETGTRSFDAGMTTADQWGLAVLDACDILHRRLQPYISVDSSGTWEDLVLVAVNNRVDLTASGVCSTSDRKYFVCGASCSEVEVDCLSGECHVTRTDLVIDVGRNPNQAVDIGHIEGAFMLGYGLYVLEDYQVRPDGVLLTLGPGTYKIPSIGNIPSKMNVHLLNDINKEGTTNESEGVADLSVVLSLSVFFAITDAVKSARADAGSTGRFQLDCPATPETVRMACQDQFTKQVQNHDIK